VVVTAGLVVAGPSQAQLHVYPAKGQSQQQLDADHAECTRWAASQAPAPAAGGPDRSARAGGAVRGAARGAAVGAAVGAIAGDAGKGAGAGAAVGGVAGRRRAIGGEQAAQNTAADSNARAFAACMEARGYSVR